MGKKIDYFVLTASITVALYLYLAHAIGSSTWAAIFAFIGCITINRLFRSAFRRIHGSAYMKKRSLRRDSRSALMYLACMDEASAEDKLRNLIRKIYGEDYDLSVLLRHPSSSISENDVFRIWKQRKGSDRLIICTTARADDACKSLCTELRAPKLALIDSCALAQMIAEHPEGMFPTQEVHQIRRMQFKRLRSLVINRKNAPRCLAMFLSMLIIYIFSANLFYLVCALFLLFVALASLHQKGRPAKLF